MKRILTLLLLVAFSVSILTACAGAEKITASLSDSGSKQTLTLGSTWTDVGTLTNDTSSDITVTNAATSSYDVTVRILSKDGTALDVSEKTIRSGYSETFPSIPSGSCLIQAKSSDGVLREYTLFYGN